MKRPYVIAINAISGGGKTVLSTAISKTLPSAALYCFDDFDTTNIYPNDFYDWWLRGSDLSEFDCPGMYKVVSAQIEKNEVTYIILDYPFGRQHERFSKLIDLSIFIDTPLDVALARRILRGDHADMEGMRRDLEHYLSKARVVYIDACQAKNECDLVLDGMLSLDALIQIVTKTATTSIRE